MPVSLEDFKPTSKLVTKTSQVDKTGFKAIDAHIHLQSPFGSNWTEQPTEYLLEGLDAGQCSCCG